MVIVKCVFMETSFIEIKNLILFKKIKDKLDPREYVECGECGAVKYNDSRSLARMMDEMLNEFWKVERDFDEAIFYDVLFQLIECEPDFNNDEKSFEWYKENQHRQCEFWDGSECYYYKSYDDVVLFYDKSCKCFNKPQDDRSPEYVNLITKIRKNKNALDR